MPTRVRRGAGRNRVCAGLALTPNGKNIVTDKTIYWDDLAVGAVYEGGRYVMDRDRIKSFAAEFDPRPTHMDDDAAAATLFGGLSASGAQTFAAWARLYWDITPDFATQAGAELQKVRFLRPVRPGDVLSLRFEILHKRPVPMRPGYGFVEAKHEVLRQDGRPVLEHQGWIIMEMRPAA